MKKYPATERRPARVLNEDVILPKSSGISAATNEVKSLVPKNRRFVSVDDKETCKKIQSAWKSRGNLLEKLNKINGLLDHPIDSTDTYAAATVCQRHVRGWLERRYIL